MIGKLTGTLLEKRPPMVMVDVNEQDYPSRPWARHLLHIGVTRAAHQLWLVSTGAPSPLIPAALRDGGRMTVA